MERRIIAGSTGCSAMAGIAAAVMMRWVASAWARRLWPG